MSDQPEAVTLDLLGRLVREIQAEQGATREQRREEVSVLRGGPGGPWRRADTASPSTNAAPCWSAGVTRAGAAPWRSCARSWGCRLVGIEFGPTFGARWWSRPAPR